MLHGDVAQLGEHQVRNLGVEGSIPFVSTMIILKLLNGYDFVLNAYSIWMIIHIEYAFSVYTTFFLKTIFYILVYIFIDVTFL